MTKTSRARGALWALVAVGGATLVLGVVWTLLATLALTADINECLDNKGACSQRAEQRNRETQAVFVRVNVATIRCISQQPPPATTEALLRCVEEAVARPPLSEVPPPVPVPRR